MKIRNKKLKLNRFKRNIKKTNNELILKDVHYTFVEFTDNDKNKHFIRSEALVWAVAEFIRTHADVEDYIYNYLLISLKDNGYVLEKQKEVKQFGNLNSYNFFMQKIRNMNKRILK